MEDNYQLAKWLNDELTAEERAAFESAPDYHLYEKIKAYSSELTTSDFKEEPLLAKILTESKQPQTVTVKETKTISLNAWFGRIAAILVLGIGMYFAITTFSEQKEMAANGKQLSFVLPDNSEVLLNSGSEINYKKWNWDSHRLLDLNGEAYFKVAKGKKFEVITPLGKVAVLGTQFNVKARNNRFDVTCFEGRVQVNYQNQQLVIGKGQTVAFTGNEKIIDQKTEMQQPYWTMGQMVFEKATLTDVLEEIEREYDIAITTKSVSSAQLFSGMLPDNDIQIALGVIATTYHLKVTKIADTRYLLESTK